VSIMGSGVSTTSDVQGNFTVINVPAGTQVFDIDASTANPGPGNATYASVHEQLELLADVTNTVERPFFLPRIDAASATQIIPGATTVVTNPNIGVTLTIASDAAKNQDGSNYLGEISISEVPDGLAPAALPGELNPSLLITIQPVGVVFDPPAQIIFPNTDNLADGNEVNIWSLEAGTGTFIPVGQGVVSGTQILPIAGQEAVIRAADWHFQLPPRPKPGGGTVPKKKKPDPCENKKNSRIPICSGELIEEHQLASYRSLEVNHAPKLIYRSLSAAPQPIISNNPTLSKVSAVPNQVSIKLEVGGVQQGAEVFTDTSGLSETVDETIRQVLQFDATAFPTGDHPYRLTLTNHFGASTIGRFTTGLALIQNEQQSPFGAGWTLEGLGHLTLQADGKAVITEGNGGAVVFDRPAPGSFASPVVLATNTTNGTPPLVADFNNDARLDILVPATFGVNGSVDVHLGTGTGTFGGGINTFVNGQPNAYAMADFDQDGNLDIIRTSSHSFFDNVAVVYGTGTGTFVGQVQFSIPVIGFIAGPNAVTVADFNNDGKPDFVTSNINNSNAVVRLGNGGRGAGAFGPPLPSITFGGAPSSDLAAADFNGDGHMDLAVARNTLISVLYGDGTGDFLTPSFQNFFGLSLALNLTVGDFNQDGFPDLAATGSAFTTGTIVYYFQNNGIGGFLPRQDLLLQPNSSPDTVEAADLNNDGFLDLITANSGGAGVMSVFFGDGLGNFTGPVEVTLNAGTVGVSVGDLDGTGTIDVVGRTTSHQVRVVLNADPNGGFLSPAGDFTTLTENPDSTFTRRLKDGTQIHFDALGRQILVVDRNGNTTTYAYDGTSDRVVTITDPVGLQTTFAYGPDNKLDTMTDPANRVTTFDHDANGDLIAITEPDNTTHV